MEPLGKIHKYWSVFLFYCRPHLNDIKVVFIGCKLNLNSCSTLKCFIYVALWDEISYRSKFF